MSVYFFIHHHWVIGLIFIFLDFLVGVVASSIHYDKTPSELAAGHPSLKLALQRESGLLGGEESRLIATALIKLIPIVGIASFILASYIKLIWYYSFLLSLLIAWLVPCFLSIFAFILIWLLKLTPDMGKKSV